MKTFSLLALSLVAAFGCEKKIAGRKLASGVSQRLTVQKNGVAFLLDAIHPDEPGVPQDLYIGDLWAGSLDKPAARVGSGVSSQPGAFAFSKDGSIVAYLARFRFHDGKGELWAARMGPGVPEQIGREVSSFAWSPAHTALAFVAPDTLSIRGAYELRLPGLQNIAWSPDGMSIAARASSASGGAFWFIDALHGTVRQVGAGITDFAFSPKGVLAFLGSPGPKGGDRPLIVDGLEMGAATAFQFSPDGAQIAILSTEKQPGEATGELFKMPMPAPGAPPGVPVLVASKVSDWRWSSTGELLSLARYDLRARAGTLVVSGGGAPRELSSKVQAFTAFGKKLLYLVQAPQKGDYKLELWSVDLGGNAAPRKVDEGVYGWDMTGDSLLYKARCAGGPRACSLLRVPFDGSKSAEMVAADVAGFDLSADGSRVLVQQPHHGSSKAVDLVVVPTGNVQTERLKVVIEEADPSARFSDDSGKHVVYATNAKEKQGVYVADVP
jgi:hypothetical protein